MTQFEHNPFTDAEIAAHLPSSQGKQRPAQHMVVDHLASFPETSPGYLAWSGGKDSTAALALTLTVNPNIPVAFFDSGLEFPETIQYIKHIQTMWNVNLHIMKAEPDALTILEQTGAWTHDPLITYNSTTPNLHTTLIYTPAQTAHEQFGAGEITGMRAGESAPRRILLVPTKGTYTRKDGTQVCAPLWNWTDRDINAYLTAHLIPINPVYTKLRKLGAPPHQQRAGLAFDANALEWGRATWLRLGWPHLWEQIAHRIPRINEWR